jgi:flagellar hook-basal body complex protein FliE
MALVNVAAAVAAYRHSLGVAASSGGPEVTASHGGAAAPGFGAALQRALQGVIETGQTADAAAARAVTGDADVTQVVTAVAKAELALQATVAIRDRVIAAYQEVMRMPI